MLGLEFRIEERLAIKGELFMIANDFNVQTSWAVHEILVLKAYVSLSFKHAYTASKWDFRPKYIGQGLHLHAYFVCSCRNRLWRDCTGAQALLSRQCLHMRSN